MDESSQVAVLRERVRRLERCLVAGTVLFGGFVALAAKGLSTDRVEASAFVLKDQQNRVVATLACDREHGLPSLKFFNSLNAQRLMELGTDGPFGGYPFIELVDQHLVNGKGTSLILENEGLPGRPRIRMSTPPDQSGYRAGLEIALERGVEGSHISLRGWKDQELWRVPPPPPK